jgi:hypothetical protein
MPTWPVNTAQVVLRRRHHIDELLDCCPHGPLRSSIWQRSRHGRDASWLWAREELTGLVDVLVADEAARFSLANTVAWPAAPGPWLTIPTAPAPRR